MGGACRRLGLGWCRRIVFLAVAEGGEEGGEEGRPAAIRRRRHRWIRNRCYCWIFEEATALSAEIERMRLDLDTGGCLVREVLG